MAKRITRIDEIFRKCDFSTLGAASHEPGELSSFLCFKCKICRISRSSMFRLHDRHNSEFVQKIIDRKAYAVLDDILTNWRRQVRHDPYREAEYEEGITIVAPRDHWTTKVLRVWVSSICAVIEY